MPSVMNEGESISYTFDGITYTVTREIRVTDRATQYNVASAGRVLLIVCGDFLEDGLLELCKTFHRVRADLPQRQ
jgi:hypothetical protein